MREEKMKAIAHIANIVREHVEGEPHLSPEKMVEALGGTIKREHKPFEYEDVDGFIQKVNSDSFEIILDSSRTVKSEKFVIAHLIGHLILHMGYLMNEKKWEGETIYRDSVYYRYGYGVEEAEALFFACCYMMPIDSFHSTIRKHLQNGMYDLKPISEELGVPVPQVARYGVYYGYFDSRCLHSF